MATATVDKWKQGMDLPYALTVDGVGVLAIRLLADWVKADRSGQPLLLPPAVRAIDRLRAVFASRTPITPGFLVSLREALGLNQQEFGERLGVSKMTVSRWECGRMHPGKQATEEIRKLQDQAQREGVKVDGRKMAGRHSAAGRA
jgi:DNA-binding transcriptional regulator YiaG